MTQCPREGSRTSLRRRMLLLLFKPGLGGINIYEIKTDRLTAIVAFSPHECTPMAMANQPPPSVPSVVARAQNPAQAQADGGGPSSPAEKPIDIPEAGVHLYDSAGQLRTAIVIRFYGCDQRQALALTRSIVGGLSLVEGGQIGNSTSTEPSH